MTTWPRYFTGVRGTFTDCRAVKFEHHRSTSIFIRNDFTEARERMWTLEQALGFVEKGLWIEITEAELRGDTTRDTPTTSALDPAGAW